MTNNVLKTGDQVRFNGAPSYAAKSGATAVIQKTDDEYIYLQWDRSNRLRRGQLDGGYLPSNFSKVD